MWYENAAGGLLLVAPGYLLALLLLPPKKAGERLSAFEGLCFSAAFAVLVTSVVSHLLAAAGRFSGTNLYTAIGIVSALLAGWLLATKRSFLPFALHASDVAPTLIVVALGVIYYPPAEFIWGSGDEGVYANAGLEIAQRGGSVFRDEVLDSLPRSLLGTSFGQYCQGFYFYDANPSGPIVPHGFHLLPSFLAALHATGGLTLYFTGPIIFALVALGAFYLLVSRFAGPTVGSIATVLLGINPASVWFARMSNAEIVVEAFLLMGFAFAALAIPIVPGPSSREPASGSRLFAAGAFFGAVHLAKIEFFLLPWALLLYIVIMMVAGHRARTIAALPLGYGLFLALAAFHAFHGHRVYFVAQLFNKEMYASKNAIGYLGSYALAIALTFTAFQKRDLVVSWVERLPLRRTIFWTGVFAAILSVYLYWGLPLQSEWGGMPESELTSWQKALAVPHDLVVGSTEERTWREITFPALGLYLSTLGVFCGMVGSFVLLARRDCVTLAPFLCFVLVQTAFILLVSGSLDYGSSHPHAPGRRFITTSIPGLIAAALLPWFVCARGSSFAPLLRTVGFALCVYLTQFTLRVGLPFIRNPTHTTTVELVRELAKNAPDDVVWVIMGEDDALGTHFGNPLRFLCHQKVFGLSKNATVEEVDALLAEFAEEGWTPMLLTSDDHPNTSPAKSRLIEVLGPKGEGTFEGRQYAVAFQRHRIPTYGDFSWWPPILRFYGGPPRL